VNGVRCGMVLHQVCPGVVNSLGTLSAKSARGAGTIPVRPSRAMEPSIAVDRMKTPTMVTQYRGRRWGNSSCPPHWMVPSLWMVVQVWSPLLLHFSHLKSGHFGPRAVSRTVTPSQSRGNACSCTLRLKFVGWPAFSLLFFLSLWGSL